LGGEKGKGGGKRGGGGGISENMPPEEKIEIGKGLEQGGEMGIFKERHLQVRKKRKEHLGGGNILLEMQSRGWGLGERKLGKARGRVLTKGIFLE